MQIPGFSFHLNRYTLIGIVAGVFVGAAIRVFLQLR